MTWPSNRARAGRRAHAVGDQFEAFLASHHEVAKHMGALAWMFKVSPPGRMIKIGGRLVWKITGLACADYVGCSHAARSVVVEAKSVAGKLLAKSAVEPQQQEHLESTVEAGGIALLAVEFRDESPESVWVKQQRFAVPWRSVPWRVRRSAEAVSAEDLSGWEVAQQCYLARFIT